MYQSKEEEMQISQTIFISVICAGLILQSIIILYSLGYIVYLVKLIQKDRDRSKNAKYRAQYKSKEIEQNAKDNYTKNRIILAVLVFEAIYRVVGIIDYFHILSKQHEVPVPEYQLTTNCSLRAGTQLALYYQWGTAYNVLVGASHATLVFVLSLMNVLTLHIIKMINNYKNSKDHWVAVYLTYSIIKCIIIQGLPLFPVFILPVLVFYLGVLFADYVILLKLSKNLYCVLKRRCIEIKNHGSEEELNVLSSFEQNVKSYKYFSLILMMGFAMQIIGEFAQLTVQYFIGSALENPCFLKQYII
ncbi:hypothetical protein LOD99_2684 [Oopsacas minuta]|uniref:Uncharacterized protein n=1 Tax=Oopsacas minuta TaxID=111878 RepID=A0AAV7K2P0_9METZ|nr:hypothetical protein LOD99_2684 [Oopsacas minuta]